MLYKKDFGPGLYSEYFKKLIYSNQHSRANDNKVYLLLYIKNKKEKNNVINFDDLHILLYKTCHCFSLLM